MKVIIREQLPIVDEILGEQEAVLGLSLRGYRNHVYRMINFCFAFGELTAEEEEKVIIAGCFHDLGIWTANTFDYLGPSTELASNYLNNGPRREWTGQISTMIGEHHKLSGFKDDRLVETFRRADFVDVSLGLVKFGLEKNFVNAVRKQFPNEGFHTGLVRTAARWICRHPLNPFPVIKR